MLRSGLPFDLVHSAAQGTLGLLQPMKSCSELWGAAPVARLGAMRSWPSCCSAHHLAERSMLRALQHMLDAHAAWGGYSLVHAPYVARAAVLRRSDSRQKGLRQLLAYRAVQL